MYTSGKKTFFSYGKKTTKLQWYPVRYIIIMCIDSHTITWSQIMKLWEIISMRVTKIIPREIPRQANQICLIKNLVSYILVFSDVESGAGMNVLNF